MRYDKDKVEPIHWRTRDFLIQFHHEVKVPATAGSIVKFSFTTTNGDINFALHFVTPQNYVEVVRDSTREPSDIEPIKGSYKADYDGVFVFIFDNSYSWFTDKFVSYDIYLFQPAFAQADATRVAQSRRLLWNMIEDSRQAQVKLITSKEKYASLTSEIATLEAKLVALQQDLQNKKTIVLSAQEEVEEMEKRIQCNTEKKAGLCIRTLNKKSLTQVLSFMGKQSAAYYTCKYWKACLDDLPAAAN